MKEINLAPTDEGYGNILMYLVQGLLGEVPSRRRTSVAKLFDSMLDVTGYLAQAKPDEIQKVREYLQRVGGEL